MQAGTVDGCCVGQAKDEEWLVLVKRVNATSLQPVRTVEYGEDFEGGEDAAGNGRHDHSIKGGAWWCLLAKSLDA